MMEKISERVKWCRENQKLSRLYVANYLGIGRGSYAQKELGKRRFTVDEVAKLSKLFGVTTDTLIYGFSERWLNLIEKLRELADEANDDFAKTGSRYYDGAADAFENAAEKAENYMNGIMAQIEALFAEHPYKVVYLDKLMQIVKGDGRGNGTKV